MNWQAKSVTLIDGSIVLSDSAEWLAECEARHIATRPSIDERRAMLATVEKRRGIQARKDMEEKILAIWQTLMNKRP